MASRTKKQASVKSIKRKARKSQKIVMGRAREFLYKGFSMEQLDAMEFPELIKILPSRARRSLTREMNPEQQHLHEKLLGEKEEVKTHVRDIVVLPGYVGKIVQLYNGHSYIKFEVKPEMIGHYLGEFAPTRHDVKHSGPGVGATRSSKFMPLK